jgi:hypothetical protein
MLSTIIFIALFAFSLFSISAMIAFKVFQTRTVSFKTKREAVVPTFSFVSIAKVVNLIYSKLPVIISLVFSKFKNIYIAVYKKIVEHYTVFDDTMNGKHIHGTDIEVKQKGASSFFLKNVAEHKKKLRGES